MREKLFSFDPFDSLYWAVRIESGRERVESDYGNENLLEIQFTNLRRIKTLPTSGLTFIDLPALSEARKLPGESTLLPAFLVRWFFGGGYLKEVYTDSDLRIAFGSDKSDQIKNYIYVLKRVSNEAPR